jgi:hypothetical protein
MDTTDTPGYVRAVSMAAARSGTLAELASTRTIFAAGATACAHSTSRAISPAQAAFTFGHGPDADPFWLSFTNSGTGRPNVRLNTPKSLWMDGWSPAITTAIVCPAPAVAS